MRIAFYPINDFEKEKAANPKSFSRVHWWIGSKLTTHDLRFTIHGQVGEGGTAGAVPKP
jgi:hypothetical protein